MLDEAASLFAHRGLDRVSMRDIASAASVHPALIGRYIGGRDDLIRAVFDDLSSQLASAVLAHPLSGQGFGPDTVMGKWTRLAGALAIPANRRLAGIGSIPCFAADAETGPNGLSVIGCNETPNFVTTESGSSRRAGLRGPRDRTPTTEADRAPQCPTPLTKPTSTRAPWRDSICRVGPVGLPR